MVGLTPYSHWPDWLKFIIIAPNGLLASISCWLWWPKSDQEWRKFGFVAAYLIIFALVMHFAFAAF